MSVAESSLDWYALSTIANQARLDKQYAISEKLYELCLKELMPIRKENSLFYPMVLEELATLYLEIDDRAAAIMVLTHGKEMLCNNTSFSEEEEWLLDAIGWQFAAANEYDEAAKAFRRAETLCEHNEHEFCRKQSRANRIERVQEQKKVKEERLAKLSVMTGPS